MDLFSQWHVRLLSVTFKVHILRNFGCGNLNKIHMFLFLNKYFTTVVVKLGISESPVRLIKKNRWLGFIPGASDNSNSIWGLRFAFLTSSQLVLMVDSAGAGTAFENHRLNPPLNISFIVCVLKAHQVPNSVLIFGYLSMNATGKIPTLAKFVF